MVQEVQWLAGAHYVAGLRGPVLHGLRRRYQPQELGDRESSSDEDEDTAPPEAQQETVMIDGKPYVRSKNPYWLTYPEQPEYIYVEKGKEFKGMQERLIDAIAKAVGKEKDKGATDHSAG